MSAGALAPLLAPWAAWSVLGGGLAAASLGIRRGRPRPGPAPRLRRLGDWYGRTRSGRRLETRLRRAMIATTPARWRAGQLLVALPLVLALTAALGPGVALGLGVGAVRVGCRLVLRTRGRRRTAALERAASSLVRSLGAELSAGVSAEAAMTAVCRAPIPAHRALQPLLEGAMLRTTGGEAAGHALAAAVAQDPEATCPGLVAAAALLSLQGRAGGDPAAFERLAAALDGAIAARDDARAVTAEARLAAAAVPALSAALGAVLVSTQPAIGTGVASPLAASVLACCVLTAAGGALLARRLAMVA